MQDEVGYTPNEKDGVIWMTIKDYHDYVGTTYINYAVEEWHEAHFLRLDDDSAAENPGRWGACGAECTRHVLTLTSDVDQTVYVTAHTWDKRGVADICETVEKNNMMFVQGDSKKRSFKYGAVSADPIQMSAYETITIETEWDHTNANLPNDWSVVAWGPIGGLTLTHTKGLTSDELPFIADNGLSVVTNEII